MELGDIKVENSIAFNITGESTRQCQPNYSPQPFPKNLLLFKE